ncbi:probable protein phosphatase 2C 33 [Rhodamnia argentea]|uniref:Probable protein phosphatase 2C 33 n=1 Tax=Rhodamnia argentea TaxID=178133 RepID=A0A8B8PQU8_9MYRT|nr:probable protein phosphatase 2C 33 [Rhodamnia argentea]XP_048130525.1 probable protein phosphatase 2C 33 [Rhodamnia argentea]
MGSCLSGAGGSSVPYAPESSSGSTKAKSSSRKRQMRRNFSFESNMEMWLHRIPGRMFLNGSTDVASLFTKQGKKGVNQDAMIVWENFGSKADTTFCGVFDGHGPFGHMVAKKVRDSLPLKLSAQWELKVSSPDGRSDISCRAIGSMNSEQTSIKTVEDVKTFPNHEQSESHSDTILTLKESFLKAFKVMDKELKLHPQIDCYCSGTTAIALVKQGHDLLIGNVGDSRAVLGTRDKNNSLIAVQLTVDLKPDLPRELERIRLCRGRVFALQNEPEVARVWLPNCESPGLAMARAFGDFCLKDFGLISVPEISYRRLSDMDEFVVLATDGIWDVLSNKEVVDIVASAPRSIAARTLVETAVRTWRLKYPYAKVDDCAVVCLFLNSNSSSCASTQPASKEQIASPQENNS